jgi:hypothetical protein
MNLKGDVNCFMEKTEMDDEGGSPHLSISVMSCKKIFHEIPLLMTSGSVQEYCCKVNMA